VNYAKKDKPSISIVIRQNRINGGLPIKSRGHINKQNKRYIDSNAGAKRPSHEGM